MPCNRLKTNDIRSFLSVSFVVLLIIGPSWRTNPASAGEVGVSAAAPSGVPWEGPAQSELEVGLDWRVFSDADMDATYGSIPVLQARVSAQVARQTRFFLGLGYGKRDGDPYLSVPYFEWDRDATLKVVPVQMGFRWDLEPGRTFRLNLGLLMEAVWVQETLPPPFIGYDGEIWRESGWTHGLGMTFGPEWRSADGRRAFGFEAGVTGNSGTIGREPSHDVNLSGMSGRIYFTTGL